MGLEVNISLGFKLCAWNRGLLKVFIDVLFELLGFQKKKGFDILA